MIKNFTRYERNTEVFSRDEVYALHEKSACIIGCGGLGGNVIMSLARFGIGTLTLVDGDVFSENNLNRQLFCTEDNIGESKAMYTKAALQNINSDIEVTAIHDMLTEKNSAEILDGHDIVLDCLDSAAARLLLEDGCEAANIPFVHGAISGFCGQVSSVFPGDKTMHKLYKSNEVSESSQRLGNPSFTPQLVAAAECSEAIKILAGRGDVLRNKLLLIDLYHNSFHIIDFE